jgi:ribonuclease VapC
MVIDTSAVIAILLDEPERRQFNEALEADPPRLISAASVLEAEIVLFTRKGKTAQRLLDEFLREARIHVRPVDDEQIAAARAAFRRYGKGRHAAALNFGDCFSYALAKISGEALLYKGDDFSLTDTQPVAS